MARLLHIGREDQKKHGYYWEEALNNINEKPYFKRQTIKDVFKHYKFKIWGESSVYVDYTMGKEIILN